MRSSFVKYLHTHSVLVTVAETSFIGHGFVRSDAGVLSPDVTFRGHQIDGLYTIPGEVGWRLDLAGSNLPQLLFKEVIVADNSNTLIRLLASASTFSSGVNIWTWDSPANVWTAATDGQQRRVLIVG